MVVRVAAMTAGLKHQMSYFDLVRDLSAQLVVPGHASVLALPALFTPAGAMAAWALGRTSSTSSPTAS